MKTIILKVLLCVLAIVAIASCDARQPIMVGAADPAPQAVSTPMVVPTPENTSEAVPENTPNELPQSDRMIYSPSAFAGQSLPPEIALRASVMEQLAFDEYQKAGDLVVSGSDRFVHHSELLTYFPDAPLPPMLMDANIYTCNMRLGPASYLNLAELEEGVVMKLPIHPSSVDTVSAIYGDDSIVYQLFISSFKVYPTVEYAPDQYTIIDRVSEEAIGVGWHRDDLYYELTRYHRGDGLIDLEPFSPGMSIPAIERFGEGLASDEVEALFHNEELLGVIEAMDAWLATPAE